MPKWIVEARTFEDLLYNRDFSAKRLVECKDCKRYEKFDGVADGRCDKGEYTFPNDYCSRGERREE